MKIAALTHCWTYRNIFLSWNRHTNRKNISHIHKKLCEHSVNSKVHRTFFLTEDNMEIHLLVRYTLQDYTKKWRNISKRLIFKKKIYWTKIVITFEPSPTRYRHNDYFDWKLPHISLHSVWSSIFETPVKQQYFDVLFLKFWRFFWVYIGDTQS